MKNLLRNWKLKQWSKRASIMCCNVANTTIQENIEPKLKQKKCPGLKNTFCHTSTLATPI